ncbi:hypothetical protein Clacol_001659 [Clathrus columnatus]|uniref:Nuclear segregation protein Bfr1 n=1 Tax=Clathrus columnatus TaxID=1419009 RepID=A0AAV4ZYQ5_9AGAM|nr:hypothetical protein Clacol_001659 [Clathrus columnatus]
MPPKSKIAAGKEKNDSGTVNGKNAGKPAPSITSAEHSLPPGADAQNVGPIGKPDQAAYNAEQDKIKSEIEAVQAQLTAVKEKIASGGKGGQSDDKRTELRAELESIRTKQASSKTSRTKLQEQFTLTKDNLQKKIQALQNAKSKLSYKTVAEVDNQIQLLEKRVESGTLKLGDEKRALQEISTLKRNRRTVESFKADQDAIDADRDRVDELRKYLDDPESKALSQRYDAIRAELDEMKKENDNAMANRNKLFDERTALSAELDALYAQKRESAKKYREAGDKYYAKIAEDRARRAERIKVQRAAEEEAKRKAEAEMLLEEARIPAFQDKIEDCQTLIDYFNAKITGGSSVHIPIPVTRSGLKSSANGLPQLELRQVEQDVGEGLIVRKKKGEDEQSYFVGGKGKTKKGNKSGSSTPGPPTNAALNIPLSTLTALLELSIPPPANQSDLTRTVEDLKTKKAWFEANQETVTAENIAKVEAKIKRLINGKTDTNGDTEQTLDVPTPVVPDDQSTGTAEAIDENLASSEAQVA